MTAEPQVNFYTSGLLAPNLAVWSPPAAILELACEEHDLVAELIQSFTKDVADRLGQIRSAMTCANYVLVRYQIHAIKGSSKQMAADRVASVCEQIESASKDRPFSQLAELVRQLEARVGEVCAAMAWYQSCGGQSTN